MALIRCNQCGNQVADTAASCPHCGNPINSYNQPPQNFRGGYGPQPQNFNGGYGPQPQNFNAYNAPNNYNTAYTAPKSKTTAGLLALFLGGLGIHYFYMEKPIPGIVFLVLCWTFIPALLALIQAILMFTMTEEQFNAKFVQTPDQFPLF